MQSDSSPIIEYIDKAIKTIIEHIDAMSQMNREVMNRVQAAAYLGIHPDTLWRYVQEGKIACTSLNDGNRVHHRFLKRDLDDFLNRKRVPSLEETIEKNRKPKG